MPLSRLAPQHRRDRRRGGEHDYDNAKQHLRHTSYQSVPAKDEKEEIPLPEVAVSHEGADPDDRWATTIAVRDALRHLDARTGHRNWY